MASMPGAASVIAVAESDASGEYPVIDQGRRVNGHHVASFSRWLPGATKLTRGSKGVGRPPGAGSPADVEVSGDPGHPQAVVHHGRAHPAGLRNHGGGLLLPEIVEQRDAGQEEAPGKPSRLVLLLLVAGEERDGAQAFEA